MSDDIEELTDKAQLVFGEKFGGLYSEAPEFSLPGIKVSGGSGATTIAAKLAITAHQKGHFEKAETMDAVRNATETHDLLSISGTESIDESQNVRCDNLTFLDGARLEMTGGVSAGTSPEENLVVLAARKIVVRTPTSGAGLDVLPGPADPTPGKKQKAANGRNGTGVGGHGTNGGHGENGESAQPDRPRLMRQVVIAFDDIEVTDPEDPTQNYPALTFTCNGQDGKSGGDGGDGGHGGNGTKGSSSSTRGFPPACLSGPGRGGNGGDGGRAGHGGSGEDPIQGANLILMSTRRGIEKMLAFEYLANHGQPGKGGNPGKPGNFGWHGAEGNANWPCTHAGRDGVKGMSGQRGRPGADGAEDGHEGKIYIEILSQDEFDSMWP